MTKTLAELKKRKTARESHAIGIVLEMMGPSVLCDLRFSQDEFALLKFVQNNASAIKKFGAVRDFYGLEFAQQSLADGTLPDFWKSNELLLRLFQEYKTTFPSLTSLTESLKALDSVNPEFGPKQVLELQPSYAREMALRLIIIEGYYPTVGASGKCCDAEKQKSDLSQVVNAIAEAFKSGGAKAIIEMHQIQSAQSRNHDAHDAIILNHQLKSLGI
jgi:hypothetical protein